MKERLLKYLFSKNARHKKKVETAFGKNPDMLFDLEKFLDRYDLFMKNERITVEELVDAYLLMLEQMMIARLIFLRTGRYPSSSQKESYDNVYSNKKVMRNYMLGLALSQFLWEHHYKIFKFYCDELLYLRKHRVCLEIGSGHGLFTLEFLDRIRDFETLDVIDISSTSLDITRGIIKTLKLECLKKVNFIKADVNLYQPLSQYDFIMMGEVLEHVDDPLKMLKNVYRLLAAEGSFYLTTCANAPAMDHVYLFNNVDEIRMLIKEAGFLISKELVVPSECKNWKEIESQKIDISYAALLAK
ncbi:MAG: class I SAM-dependent methyltransferase [PVC group bacterium]|nr:class I SAM-dependent methyltransferase [PVC group bacterium]